VSSCHVAAGRLVIALARRRRFGGVLAAGAAESEPEKCSPSLGRVAVAARFGARQ